MTPLAAATSRLLQVMAQVDDRPLMSNRWGEWDAAEAIAAGWLPRRFETLLEGLHPHKELEAAYGAWRRARRPIREPARGR
jgi:hypothetical protein